MYLLGVKKRRRGGGGTLSKFSQNSTFSNSLGVPFLLYLRNFVPDVSTCSQEKREGAHGNLKRTQNECTFSKFSKNSTFSNSLGVPFLLALRDFVLDVSSWGQEKYTFEIFDFSNSNFSKIRFFSNSLGAPFLLALRNFVPDMCLL
jgi:hypothetical protein